MMLIDFWIDHLPVHLLGPVRVATEDEIGNGPLGKIDTEVTALGLVRS